MTKQTKKTAAKIISGVFHPLMMPIYLSVAMLFIPIFASFIPLRYKWYYLIIVVYSFALFPIGILFILHKLKKISSINLKEQKERFLPFLLITICYILGMRILHLFHAPSTLTILMKGVCLAIIIIALISTFWKISAHMTAIGGALGILVLLAIMYKIDLSLTAIIISLISGGVGWARLYLKCHNFKQISYGFMTGFCAVILSFYMHVLIK